jgi:hypothetical protein
MTKSQKRGPGRWQRQILAVLEHHRAFFARDLLDIAPTRTEQQALGRAIRELHDKGKIAIARWWGRNPAGGRIVIYRYGTFAPPPHETKPLGPTGMAPSAEVARTRDRPLAV